MACIRKRCSENFVCAFCKTRMLSRPSAPKGFDLCPLTRAGPFLRARTLKTSEFPGSGFSPLFGARIPTENSRCQRRPLPPFFLGARIPTEISRCQRRPLPHLTGPHMGEHMYLYWSEGEGGQRPPTTERRIFSSWARIGGAGSGSRVSPSVRSFVRPDFGGRVWSYVFRGISTFWPIWEAGFATPVVESARLRGF